MYQYHSGVLCGNPATAVVDAICDHEHVETGVPACVTCLASIELGWGICGPCGGAGYTHMQLIQARSLV